MLLCSCELLEHELIGEGEAVRPFGGEVNGLARAADAACDFGDGEALGLADSPEIFCVDSLLAHVFNAVVNLQTSVWKFDTQAKKFGN